MRRKTLSRIMLLLLLTGAGCAETGNGSGEPGGGSGDETPGAAGWAVSGQWIAAPPGARVIARSADGTEAEADVEVGGAFRVPVRAGNAYWIVLAAGDSALGIFQYQRNSWSVARSATLRVPLPSVPAPDRGTIASAATALGATDAGEDIGLGEVELDAGQVQAAENPAETLDADLDGEVDFDDPDDDGDGVPDELEEESIETSDLGLLVTRFEPAPGDDSVDPGEEIEVAFNQPLDPSTVTATNVRLLDSAGNLVDGTIALDDDGTEVKLVPAGDLEAGAEYTIVLSGVTAAGGATLPGGEVRSSFRVESPDEEEVDAPFLFVEEVDPRHQQSGVDLDEAVEVEFNLDLDPATAIVGPDGFELLTAAGVAVAGTLSVDGEKLRFEPAADLLPAMTYRIALGSGLATPQGLTLSSPLSLQFTTSSELEDEDEDEQEESDAGEIEAEEIDIVELEVDEVEVNEPEDDGPEVDEIEVDEHEVDEPEVDEPEVDEPEVDEPEVDEPEVDEPEVDEPEVDEPEVDEPEVDEPEVDEPEVDEPEDDEPEDDEPEDDEPEVDEQHA